MHYSACLALVCSTLLAFPGPTFGQYNFGQFFIKQKNATTTNKPADAGRSGQAPVNDGNAHGFTAPLPKYWISPPEQQLAFFQAADFCIKQNQNQRLVSVDNENQRAAIIKFMKKNKVSVTWTSGVYNPPSKSWIWFGLKKAIAYAPWFGHESETPPPPTPPNPNEYYCAYFEIGAFEDGAKGGSCTDTKRFICEEL